MWTPFVTIEALARSRGEKRDKKKRMISSSFLFSVSAVEKLVLHVPRVRTHVCMSLQTLFIFFFKFKLIYLKCIIHMHIPKVPSYSSSSTIHW